MTDRQFQQIAKALADPRRFAILRRIAADKEVPCRDLVRCFAVTQATISHHLRELAAAGLIASRRDGKCSHFTADRKLIRSWRVEFDNRLLRPGAGTRRSTVRPSR